MERDKTLFIGLDVGTNSVGWAATDEDFNLYRLKGKTAWGARIFDEASDAKTRRGYRTAGRRLARRKERIRLLNALFDDLLKQKDPTFLVRLENATLHGDDPNKPEEAKGEALLFKSRKEEKEYYKAYPTIWHLRQTLINNEDRAFSDIRYLYLAIHHIIKYRGNFIKSGNYKVGEFDVGYFQCLNEFFASYFENEDGNNEDAGEALSADKYAEFETILLDKNETKTSRKKKLLGLMNVTESQKKFAEMFCTLVSGGTFSTDKLNAKDEETFEKKEICFNSGYDEKEEEIRSALGDAFDLVDIAKSISDYRELNDVLRGSAGISQAFVNIYEEHKADLRALKDLCKKVDEAHGLKGDDSIYVKIFVDKESKTNYPALVHKRKECGIHEFDSFVLTTLAPFENELAGDKAWAILKAKADREHEQLLQFIALRSTSVIPMQLHEVELEKILDNAVKRNIKGIAGIKEKLLALFEYHIPYYCGPLSNKSGYSNVEFKAGVSKEKLLPWNYKDKIDFEKTKEKFMRGLTNKCTYLKGCDVLPKQSLLYQDFDAWNKLNNLTVNGHKITLDEMKDLYSFASRRKKTTLTDIKRRLKEMSQSKENDVVVSGINPNDFIDLSTRASLCDAFDLSNRYTEDYKRCEEALLFKTYFTDSPSDAESIIKSRCNLSEKQLKALKRVSCKGWASLSKEFLTLKGVDQDGVVLDSTLMDHLENGQGNLMQILHDERYNYLKVIDVINRNYFGDKSTKVILDEMIEEMPPKMRRPVIQALRIVEEVAKVAKKKPDVISLEVTRENNDKKGKEAYTKKAEDRKKQLHAFLNSLSKVDAEKERASSVAKELDAFADLGPLRGKHLFLYFLQNGKDAYTGEPIDINDVLNGTKYDTDHIIPQSMIKDDSIENLVLVKKEINQHRSNEYPLPENIRSNKNNVAFWRRLKKAGMMSDKKFNNLTRASRLTEEELSAFVAAQINVVNRSNIVIRDALKILYPEAKLIFSKAQYPSQIRHELCIPKLRDLNDTHHAVDAYLNIVAGVKLQERFGNMAAIKAAAQNDENHSLNMEGYINRLILKDDGNGPTEFGEKINKASLRHDFLLTYRFIYQDDAFYKATIYAPGEGNSLIPAHNGWDVGRYGGYTSLANETNCIATIRGKKKTTRFLLGVSHLALTKFKQGKDIEKELIANVPHKEGDEVTVDLKRPVPLNATVKKDGVCYLLMSSEVEKVQLFLVSPVFLSRSSELYLARLIKEKEKNAAKLNTNETVVVTDKMGVNKYSFDWEKSFAVAKELFQIAADKRYDYCPMVSDLRDESTQNQFLEALKESPLSKQCDMLLELLSRFTRKSAAVSGKKFRKSRGLVLQEDLTLCSTSITGLFETERKL